MSNRLSIKTNNVIVKEVCSNCRGSHKDADIPFWIFQQGTYDSVCYFCAKKHAPEMLKMVEEGNSRALNSLGPTRERRDCAVLDDREYLEIVHNRHL